jgi:RHS repeat-associated protein
VVDVFGNLEEARDYDPFGRSIAHTGDLALKHRFTGQPQDEGDGLYDYGARMYNPEWGRFISPDAHVQSFDAQGINRYAYVGNQPTSRTDPTGNFGAGAIGWSGELRRHHVVLTRRHCSGPQQQLRHVSVHRPYRHARTDRPTRVGYERVQ